MVFLRMMNLMSSPNIYSRKSRKLPHVPSDKSSSIYTTQIHKPEPKPIFEKLKTLPKPHFLATPTCVNFTCTTLVNLTTQVQFIISVLQLNTGILVPFKCAIIFPSFDPKAPAPCTFVWDPRKIMTSLGKYTFCIHKYSKRHQSQISCDLCSILEFSKELSYDLLIFISFLIANGNIRAAMTLKVPQPSLTLQTCTHLSNSYKPPMNQKPPRRWTFTMISLRLYKWKFMTHSYSETLSVTIFTLASTLHLCHFRGPIFFLVGPNYPWLPHTSHVEGPHVHNVAISHLEVPQGQVKGWILIGLLTLFRWRACNKHSRSASRHGDAAILPMYRLPRYNW